MADLFKKIDVLIRAGLNDAASNLTGNNGGSAQNAQPPTPAEVMGSSTPPEPPTRIETSQPAPKPPSDAARAAARTDEKLDAAIGLLQQRLLGVTDEIHTLDKQIDAALLDNNDEVARQLTLRLQQQQRLAQQISDDMVRYNVPLPAAPAEADNTANRVSIPVNNPASGFRVPVRTGDSAQPGPQKPTTANTSTVPSATRPVNEVLNDRPAPPDTDAKLAERRRRLSLPDDSGSKQ